jgi:hypothetical protein
MRVLRFFCNQKKHHPNGGAVAIKSLSYVLMFTCAILGPYLYCHSNLCVWPILSTQFEVWD